MGKLRHRLPRHGTVAAYLGLFVALSTGGAYAADKIGSKDIAKKAVKSKHIKNKGVKAKDIAADSIDSSKVANGSLLDTDFAAGQLREGTRGPEGPQGPKGDTGDTGPSTGPAGGDLSGTYPNPVIANGAVTAAKLSTVRVRTASASLPEGVAGNPGDASAEVGCNAGERLIGGGGGVGAFPQDDGDVYLLSSRPLQISDGAEPTAWRSSASNEEGGVAATTVHVYALCASS